MNHHQESFKSFLKTLDLFLTKILTFNSNNIFYRLDKIFSKKSLITANKSNQKLETVHIFSPLMLSYLVPFLAGPFSNNQQ